MSDKQFAPGQKVIVFDYPYGTEEGPVICWVRTGRHMRNTDGRLEVIVSRYEDEAKAGIGGAMSVKKVFPFNDVMWAGIEEWQRRRDAVNADLIILARGKVPHHYRQKTLFAEVAHA